ncbi:MAG: hypothetical protein JO170_02125 [Verrucomicrobia bacterium]|nr:hypothetical protein [Verrucomicrobiota bacterium]
MEKRHSDQPRSCLSAYPGLDESVLRTWAASIRNLQHLLYAFQVHSELVTVPAKISEKWAKEGMPLPGDDFAYKPVGAEVPIEHELSTVRKAS